jgi:hypothetical protein
MLLHEYNTLPPQVNGINCWDRKENETESILRNCYKTLAWFHHHAPTTKYKQNNKG